METYLTESQAADAEAIERQRASRTAAWNRGDARGFVANFDDDGSFTNITGTMIRGRQHFEQRVAQILATIFAGSTMTTAIRRLRFIRPDVAIANVDSEITGFRDLPPGVRARDGVLPMHQIWVLVKEGDEWLISAFHNVDVKHQ